MQSRNEAIERWRVEITSPDDLCVFNFSFPFLFNSSQDSSVKKKDTSPKKKEEKRQVYTDTINKLPLFFSLHAECVSARNKVEIKRKANHNRRLIPFITLASKKRKKNQLKQNIKKKISKT